ncbi:hypothetical protein SUDANB6_02060 [Streptomyces sp. enrichment culture]
MECLLPPRGNRRLRTRAVAARAGEAFAAVSEADRDLLVAAARLHDIGYASELRDTGFRPLDGARHLESLGAPARLVRLAAHHSGAVYEAERRGLSAEPGGSPVPDALVFAGMTTGPAGQSFGFGTRTDEILGHHDPGFRPCTCTHLMPGDGKRTGEAVNRAFADGPDTGDGSTTARGEWDRRKPAGRGRDCLTRRRADQPPVPHGPDATVAGNPAAAVRRAAPRPPGRGGRQRRTRAAPARRRTDAAP